MKDFWVIVLWNTILKQHFILNNVNVLHLFYSFQLNVVQELKDYWEDRGSPPISWKFTHPPTRKNPRLVKTPTPNFYSPLAKADSPTK